MLYKGSRETTYKNRYVGQFQKTKKKISEMQLKILEQENELNNKELLLQQKKKEIQKFGAKLKIASAEINKQKPEVF